MLFKMFSSLCHWSTTTQWRQMPCCKNREKFMFCLEKAGPRFMLHDQRAMQNIFPALNLKLIIFATAIIHQVTQVQHQSLQTLTKLVRKLYFFLPSWSVIFVGWFHICSLIILCEKSRFFAKLKFHILG